MPLGLRPVSTNRSPPFGEYLLYFVDIGRSAYQHLHEKAHSIYGQLAMEFVPMMDVLHAMRGLDADAEPLSLLESYQLWEESDSQNALFRIKTQVPGHITLIKGEHSKTRH